MAAITAISVDKTDFFTSAITTLGSSDTLTYDSSKKQLLVLRNTTGGSLTLNIDGADGTTVSVPGVGTVNVSSGVNVTVAAGASKSVLLSSIRAYLQGVVTLSGASGMTAQLFNF